MAMIFTRMQLSCLSLILLQDFLKRHSYDTVVRVATVLPVSKGNGSGSGRLPAGSKLLGNPSNGECLKNPLAESAKPCTIMILVDDVERNTMSRRPSSQ
eukprot:scaffold566870_cov17-Prasinocladus_malaysianus.AAC.2